MGHPCFRLDSVVAPAPPLGGAISERLHEHRTAAPLVRLGRPSSSRERLKARLVAADVPPIDALDDFVRRKGQRAYRVRASIRDDVVGLQHKYDLMKQMVEGRPAPRPAGRTPRAPAPQRQIPTRPIPPPLTFFQAPNPPQNELAA